MCNYLNSLSLYYLFFFSDCSVILLLKTDESGENNQQQQEKIVLVPWIDLTKISEKKITAKDDDDKNKVEIQKQQQQQRYYQKIREQLLLPKGRLSQAAVSGGGHNNDNDRVDLKRKAQVIDLLQRHQIQVTQVEDDNCNNQLIIQGGLARLRPPYRQFEASNVIVLDRLNSLLDQMPGQ